MNKKLIVSAFIIASASVAHAGFVDESSANPFSANTPVRVIGSDNSETLHGFADGVPLHQAVTQIVPRDYHLRSIGIDRVANTAVSWKGGKDWTSVLRDVVSQVPALSAEVDTNSRIVTLTLKDGVVEGTQAQGASDAAVNAASAVWDLRFEDKTVRTALERWAASAGWQMVWELNYDYPIGASASLNQTFEGAIETVMRSMESVEFPPKAIFYRGNQVVRIVNKGVE